MIGAREVADRYKLSRATFYEDSEDSAEDEVGESVVTVRKLLLKNMTKAPIVVTPPLKAHLQGMRLN